MSRSFSLYLDLFRVLAAFAVFLHHFAFYRFTEGRYSILNSHNFGTDGVIVFFVLSGLVIAYCGDEKDPTLRSFAFSRATRLLSVAVPALIIGFAADRLGAYLYPIGYAGPWYEQISFANQLFSGLTFSNEWWISVSRLGSNGPYWSLSYEAAYYALFAVAFYLKPPFKWLIVIAMLAVFGVAIILLLPCWLAGWAVWRLIASGWSPSRKIANLMAFGPLPVFAVFVVLRLDRRLQEWNQETLPEWLLTHISHRAIGFEWAYILTILMVLHFIGMNRLLRDAAPVDTGRFARTVRYFSGASFSIYLLHYPLLHFFAPILRPILPGVVSDVALLGVTIAICLSVAAVFERTLGTQRRAIKLVSSRVLKRAHNTV